MLYQGKFKPKNPLKYKGNPTNIIYRSFWEFKLMKYLDAHPEVLSWASEEHIIPYRSPIDNKFHRYFPDFWVKKLNNGIEEICLIEVKPLEQTKAPKRFEGKGKPTRRYLQEVMTYGVNAAKWKAAEEYCLDRGWKFYIMTEKELGIK